MKHHVTAAAIAAIVAFGIGYLPKETAKQAGSPQSSSSAPHAKETAYERVMRTGTLRCGYALYAPMLTRDPNTNQMSGIAADVINAAAKSLDLKVEWTGEFGFATVISDLEAGRFDATCVGFWRLPLEAKRLTYTLPFLYSQMSAYARAGDARFDKDIAKINDKSVRIISADGQMSSAVARQQFPDAQLVELPNMSSLSQQIEDVIAGKADIVINESAAAEDYMAKNPGKIVKTAAGNPIRVFQDTFAMRMGEHELKTMLDTALINIIENGDMDRILAKYDPDGTRFKRVAKGYAP